MSYGPWKMSKNGQKSVGFFFFSEYLLKYWKLKTTRRRKNAHKCVLHLSTKYDRNLLINDYENGQITLYNNWQKTEFRVGHLAFCCPSWIFKLASYISHNQYYMKTISAKCHVGITKWTILIALQQIEHLRILQIGKSYFPIFTIIYQPISNIFGGQIMQNLLLVVFSSLCGIHFSIF